ncbi:hypothetical protein ACUR5C_16015 [Aliikangiella sp. IMCC44653]
MQNININRKELSAEWQLLQTQFDSYEKFSLLIKLFSFSVFLTMFYWKIQLILSLAVLASIWLQDAIWKTYQARIETRLTEIEKSLNTQTELSAYQFNSEFNVNRPGILGLFKTYFCQAIRPTIAFPHAMLIVLVIAFKFL